MATYYFDAVNGSNTTGDGSIGNPWQFYDGKHSSMLAGDKVLFKRGTLQIVNSLYLSLCSGTLGNPTYYGVYGDGTARVRWFSNNTWGHILNGVNNQYVTLEDFDFDCSNQQGGSIYLAGQTTGTVTGITLRRCSFFGSTLGSGLSIAKETASSTAVVSNCLVEDCDAYDNGSHGFMAIGASNIVFRRCRAWGNGGRNPDGGHGFSARALRQTYTSGWTLVAGSVYSRPLNANESDATYVQTNGTYTRLYRNVSTPTAPAAGEFGVSGGLLYVNIGTNPNGVSVGYAFANCTGVLWEDCESFGNIWNAAAPYHEGHGFAFDDYTQNSIMRRCYSHDNQGLGISNNRGDNNIFESNIVVNNWQSGFTAQPCDNIIVRNNTFLNNNIGTGSHTGEVRFSTSFCRNGALYNNIIQARDSTNTYGIDVDPASTGFTASNNNITNCVTPVRTVTATNTTAYSQQLNSSYRVKTNASIIGGGTWVTQIQDNSWSSFQNPPSIGAFEYIRPRTFRS